MAHRPQAAIEAGDTLENLVDQFTDPFAFLRELIQNAMDAGTTRVDVDFEFRPYDSTDKGILILHVADTGEGMNREIIDTQLTRLFSSSKENDLTKIGKFGIGFVSVFALRPKAVIVDTGRDGEYWRIFFKEDKTFDRIVLDHPVEGTHIQFIKEVERKAFEEYRDRGRRTIVYWCKHSETEIYVDGELVNERFGLRAPYTVTQELPGTTVVVAPSEVEEPLYGFYNRGLTLSEGNKAFIEGIQFKIKSRYLEHTLTRDNVMQDENYEKALGMLHRTVEGPFRERLFETARKNEDDKVFGHLVPRLEKLPDKLASMPILPTFHGPPLSIKDVSRSARKAGELFWDDASSTISEALGEESTQVLQWKGPEEEPGKGRLLRALAGKAVLRKATRAWALPVLLQEFADRDRSLLDSAARILNRAGSPYRQLVPSNFDYPGSAITDSLYQVQHKAGELIRLQGKKTRGLWPSLLFGRGTGNVLLLNVSHPLIEPHFRLVDKHPALAAYLLAKAVTLDDGLDPVTEARLVEAAMEEEAAARV